MERIWRGGLLFVTFLLAACSGGGGGGEGSPEPAGVSALEMSYPSPQVLVISQPISPLSPTVNGSVTSYSVSPELPSGLTLDANSGQITGTPSAVTATTTYTVTASNAAGSATAAVSITVNDAAPSISYGETSHNFVTGVATTALTPANSGGAATSWSIDHAPPAGLTFDTTDGTISGVPTVASEAATYIVTASNSGGSESVELTIAVDSGTLLDLGHSDEIVAIRNSGNRALSVDRTGHWVLWDLTTAANVARGEATCEPNECPGAVELAGPTFVVRTSRGMHVRDSADGALLADVIDLYAPARWLAVATDGSYVAFGSNNTLKAYSRSGTPLFSRLGNYGTARAFAAPTELRVAAGAAGISNLERIAVATGAATTTPFQGDFSTWFVDGNRFLTYAWNQVFVYQADGAELGSTVLPTPLAGLLGGTGDWFWSVRSVPWQMHVYSVSALVSPTATFTLPFPGAKPVASGETVGILSEANFSIVDLSGGAPVKTDYTAPFAYPVAYSAASTTRWLLGNHRGALLARTAASGTPEHFGWGAAHSIVATDARIAVATASGRIAYFDGSSRQLVGTIDFAASKLQLSENGTVLAALANTLDGTLQPDRTIRVFSLPSGNVIHDAPYAMSTPPWPLDISLSASGDVLGKVLSTTAEPTSTSTLNREVTPLTGGTVLWQDTVTTNNHETRPVHLSPTGTLIAASTGGRATTTQTNIVVGGTPTATVTGLAAGWIDEDRLLVNRFFWQQSWLRYDGSTIVNAAGQSLAALTLPGEVSRFQPMSDERIYAPEPNLILSLSDGQTMWDSSNPTRGVGGVTGTHVVFASGAVVRAEPY